MIIITKIIEKLKGSVKMKETADSFIVIFLSLNLVMCYSCLEALFKHLYRVKICRNHHLFISIIFSTQL